MQNYLSDQIYVGKISADTPEFDKAEQDVRERINKLFEVGQKAAAGTTKTVDHFQKALGHIMWEYVGMARNTESLTTAKKLVCELEEEFWKEVSIPGKNEEMNPELEKGLRTADNFELARLMIQDALHRE